jgi:hypothetical protein
LGAVWEVCREEVFSVNEIGRQPGHVDGSPRVRGIGNVFGEVGKAGLLFFGLVLSKDLGNVGEGSGLGLVCLV